MSGTLFDLRPTHNPHRWYLPITESMTVGTPDNAFMFGGIGLAASVTALERTCQRPIIWAVAQYLSFARTNSVVDLDVWIPVNGTNTTQARVVCHVGDAEILTVNASLGQRAGPSDDSWVTAPDVPPPSECREAFPSPREVAGVLHKFEIRVAHGRFRTETRSVARSNDGRVIIWLRPADGHVPDTATLAVMADYLPGAVEYVTGQKSFGTSLDNTIRFTGNEPTDWVLCDMHIEAVHRGFAHGTLRMFSTSGKLLAIGSQSILVRSIAR